MYFYIPYLHTQQISLPQSAHLVSCRISAGDLVQATDLRGNLATLKITTAEPKSGIYKFEIISTHTRKNNTQKNILFQAKIDKLYLEKLVEIVPLANIDKVVFFDSDYSQKKQSVNLERLEKILIRSCEQSQTIFKPELIFIDSDTELLSQIKKCNPIVLEGKIPTTKDSNHSPNILNSIVVGPEGGWSLKELALFKSLNLRFKNLGDSVYPAWLAGFVWFTLQLD
jgi:16S rRNA (uracil1498-N3)-methyltransferase